MEWTRAIIHNQGLPLKLWAEILDTVYYLYTLGPIHAIKNSTPLMAFQNKSKDKPNVDHLRIIGCTAYMHINKQLHTKLDTKSIKCILVGYGNDCRVYHVWNPKNDKVFYSRDIVFDETQIGIQDIIIEDTSLLDIDDDP